MQTRIRHPLLTALFLLTANFSMHSALAQDEVDLDGVYSELELRAIFTAGNTKVENIKFKGSVAWLRERWEYGFSLDGFRSSKDDVLAAQRLYGVLSATYNQSTDSFILTRAAHEDDRFSGCDSQSDITVSYGHNLLSDRENMDWNYTVGLSEAPVRSAHWQRED